MLSCGFIRFGWDLFLLKASILELNCFRWKGYHYKGKDVNLKLETTGENVWPLLHFIEV